MPVKEFCEHYNVEFSFISSLAEFGLMEIATVEQKQFIYTTQLRQLEKIIRLHYEMDINLEGIEAITHLLDRVGRMQQEITFLKNKLSFLSSNIPNPESL
jgi:hypothetical protein